ncbi:MAG: hypothetical protein QMD50_03645 [Patescibacteria group bacterium]|nr:hypothetical protein [Patescibacteria group bacterium]
MKWKKIEVILEFLIFGIIIGVIEDLIAVTVTTGEPITWKIIGIIVLVAIPFAFIGEVIADQIDFSRLLEKIFSKKSKITDVSEKQ